jgi:5-methylcytosine-specific restriction endonuclease McrA
MADGSTYTLRQVPEWIGKTPDTPVPKAVKTRLLLRYGGKCYRTGHRFRPGDAIEFDHIVALCNGGENRESNLAPILGGKPHQEKTKTDRDEKTKTDRMRLKALGLWPKSKRPLQGRGFSSARDFPVDNRKGRK